MTSRPPPPPQPSINPRARKADSLVRYPTKTNALRTYLNDSRQETATPAKPSAQRRVLVPSLAERLVARTARAEAPASPPSSTPRQLVLKARTRPEAPAPTSADAQGAAKALGRTLRLRRQSLDLTQQDLAAQAKVGRRLIVELEAGKPTLEIGKVLAVCHALGLALAASVADG